jgi:hypothetical protein
MAMAQSGLLKQGVRYRLRKPGPCIWAKLGRKNTHCRVFFSS